MLATIRPEQRIAGLRASPTTTASASSNPHAHWQWFITKCSQADRSISATPPNPSSTPSPGRSRRREKQIDAVAAAGREVRRVRAEALPELKGGLRALYRTLELPGTNPLKDAHAALDAAVLAAYGFSPKTDLLAQLLALNLDVAARIDAGEPVTAPGVPPAYPRTAPPHHRRLHPPA